MNWFDNHHYNSTATLFGLFFGCRTETISKAGTSKDYHPRQPERFYYPILNWCVLFSYLTWHIARTVLVFEILFLWLYPRSFLSLLLYPPPPGHTQHLGRGISHSRSRPGLCYRLRRNLYRPLRHRRVRCARAWLCVREGGEGGKTVLTDCLEGVGLSARIGKVR